MVTAMLKVYESSHLTFGPHPVRATANFLIKDSPNGAARDVTFFVFCVSHEEFVCESGR